MKTKAIDKKGKKKSLNKASVIIDSTKKLKKEVVDKRNLKRAKRALKATVIEQNGSSINKKKQVIVDESDENKAQRKDQFNRAFMREKRKEIGTYNVSNIKLDVEQIKARITAIKSRDVLTKTAKRKLSLLQRKLRTEESADKSVQPDATSKKTSALVKIKQDVNHKDKIPKNKNKKNKQTKEKNDQDDSNVENKTDKNKGDAKKKIGTKRPIESNESTKANKKNKVQIVEIKKKGKKEAAINVQYTNGAKDKDKLGKKSDVAKNKKGGALRKTGQGKNKKKSSKKRKYH